MFFLNFAEDIKNFMIMLYEFLFLENEILTNIVGEPMTLFQVMAGIGFPLLFAAWLVKKLVPVA